MTFKDSELVEALLAALSPGEGEEGVTTWELAEAMGVCQATARARVRRGMAAGVIEHVRVQRERMNGRWTETDGYRPKEAR